MSENLVATQFTLPCGLVLKNRIAKAPMTVSPSRVFVQFPQSLANMRSLFFVAGKSCRC
jgi:2,4-dienoyl-CoA reductase-like NADH-dependent reductase (Old Yellow Enzyme family)